jgi:hypothetical protein
MEIIYGKGDYEYCIEIINKKITLDYAFELIWRYLKVSKEALINLKRGKRDITDAKCILYKLLYIYYIPNNSEIGRILKKDPSTILLGIKQVNNIKELKEKYNLIANEI